MANYDLIETVKLPVFKSDVVYVGDRSPWTFKFTEPPVRAYPINVYEYSGTVSSFDFAYVDGSQIVLAISSVKNWADVFGESYSRITLFIGQNYTTWNQDSVNGYGVFYDTKDLDTPVYRYFDSVSALATGFEDTIQCALVKSPSSGLYFLIVRDPNGDTNYLVPYGNSERVSILVDYTGEELNPEEPEPNPNPYNPGGNSATGGGDGLFGKDEISDNISADIPSGSTFGDDGATGMYTRYLMNPSQLELLGDWMWDPSLGLSLIKELKEAWFGQDSGQMMIGMLSFPFSITAPIQGVNIVSQNAYFGNISTNISMNALKSSAGQVDWGTIELKEYWGNFLDYSPHTKIELYLPWGTGYVELDPGQCLPGTINVKTNIDFVKGSCVHSVINGAGCVIGTYAGQCAKYVPLMSSDISAKRAGAMVAGVTMAVGGAVIAGASAAGASAGAAAMGEVPVNLLSKTGKPLYGAARSSRVGKIQRDQISAYHRTATSVEKSMVKTGSKFKREATTLAKAAFRHPASVSRSGSFSDSDGGMAIQYPFIILSRPEQNVPENYGHYYGYPSNVYQRLTFLSGYSEISSIHLENIPCTLEERSELENILVSGVIF